MVIQFKVGKDDYQTWWLSDYHWIMIMQWYDIIMNTQLKLDKFWFPNDNVIMICCNQWCHDGNLRLYPIETWQILISQYDNDDAMIWYDMIQYDNDDAINDAMMET